MRARQNNMIHLSSTFPFVSHSAGKALTPSHSELSGATTLQTTKTSSATASLAILSACARASSRVVNPLLWHPSGQYEARVAVGGGGGGGRVSLHTQTQHKKTSR